MKKKVWKIALGILLALVLTVGGYVTYVFTAYYRLEDRLLLEIQGQAAEELAAGEILRLVSYNIGFGAYSDDYSFFMDGGKESRARSVTAVHDNIRGAMEAAQALNPDLLLLQEVDVDGTRSRHVDQAVYIRSLYAASQLGQYVFAQNYDSPYLFWPLLEPHGANRAGQLTMSRYPIASALRRSLPIEEGFMKLVDLDRCYAVHRIPVSDGRELVLYNLHLSAYTSDGAIAEEQLKMLFADMVSEYEQGNWAVAGGDFNKDLLGTLDLASGEVFGVSGEAYTWAQPIPAQLVPEGVSIVPPFNPDTLVASCRNADRPYGPDNFRVTVDGFIVSDNVFVFDAAVVDTGFRWSDHNPVLLDFVLMG